MRDEFVDTCGLCDAPLRMGQRCACGDNWRATPPAPAQPASAEQQPVAWFSPEQKRAMAIIQSAAKALEEGTFTAPPAHTPCPHIRSSGTGDHATNWCALAEQPALHEAVDILRKLLTHGWAEDCQECAIGQSSAWADAKALIARVDAQRRDGGGGE